MKKILQSEHLPLSILIAVNLTSGFLTLRQFGESWDEQNYYFYAEQSLHAYTGLFTPGFTPTYDPTIRYYGPVYVLIPLLLNRILPSILISDLGHAVNLITFQLGLVVFYQLARRWLKPWSAFAATALLSTQPLLWGHGVINPKDMPFMVAFMASIWLGLNLRDDLDNTAPMPVRSALKLNDVITADLRTLKKSKIGLLIAASLLVVSASIYAAFQVVALGESLLPPISPTDSAAALEAYLRPQLADLWRLLLSTSISLFAVGLVWLPNLHATKQELIDNRLKPVIESIVAYARRRSMILAAIVLGLTACIRLFGFAAFVFVAVFLFIKYRRQAIHILLPYLAIALLVMYITYPFLWPEPLARLLITFRIMLNFPWPGLVLFNGMQFAPDALPWYYLPTLYGIQFTEPLILLAIVGILVIAYKWTKGQHRDFGLLAGLWFVFPFLFAVIMRPSLYDNARQFFFILPPLFLFAGFALEALLERFPIVWKTAGIVLILLPGVVQLFRLHPYQYMYYNSLVGGVEGAAGRFETDYWATSFRSAAEYLNTNAPPDSLVFVSGPESCVWRYTRPDLKVSSIASEAELSSSLPDDYYAVISARDNNNEKLYPDAPVIFEVTHSNVVLAVIKHVVNPQ